MENRKLELRLEAIENALGMISLAISEGTSPQEFSKEIDQLRNKLTSGSISPDRELVVQKTVMILNPLAGDPWEPF